MSSTAETDRLKEELTQLTTEAEDAKKNLIAFKDEIEKLKVEKVRMMARLRNAQARVRIQQALESLSYDEDVRSLEEVRESIQQTLAQAGVNRELHSAEVDEKLAEIRRRNAEAKARGRARRHQASAPRPGADGCVRPAQRQRNLERRGPLTESRVDAESHAHSDYSISIGRPDLRGLPVGAASRGERRILPAT